MNHIIALCLLLILSYFSFFKYEFFQDSTSQASSTTPAAPTRQSLSFFELSNADKNKINKIEREEEMLNVEREEQKMKNNVRKIIKDAENVLAYTDLNMEYFKEIKFNNEQTQPVNSGQE